MGLNSYLLNYVKQICAPIIVFKHCYFRRLILGLLLLLTIHYFVKVIEKIKVGLTTVKGSLRI
jgi:hypothetical protein